MVRVRVRVRVRVKWRCTRLDSARAKEIH